MNFLLLKLPYACNIYYVLIFASGYSSLPVAFLHSSQPVFTKTLILVINWRGITDPSSFSPFERKVILIGWCIIVIMGSIYFNLFSIRQMFALEGACCRYTEHKVQILNWPSHYYIGQTKK